MNTHYHHAIIHSLCIVQTKGDTWADPTLEEPVGKLRKWDLHSLHPLPTLIHSKTLHLNCRSNQTLRDHDEPEITVDPQPLSWRHSKPCPERGVIQKQPPGVQVSGFGSWDNTHELCHFSSLSPFPPL